MLTDSVLATHIADTVREPLLVLDAELHVLAANRAFLDVFRTTREEAVGQMVYTLGNGEWDIPALRSMLETLLPASSRFDDFEVDHVFRRLGRRVMLLNAREILGSGADAKRTILLAIEDVTTRRLAEEALADRSAALERSNRELEQFAAIASHDLQEPLRKIRTYAELLQRKYAPSLEPGAQDYIDRMSQAAGRMQTLIGDLLQLSRVTAVARPFVSVDLTKVIGEVLVDLEVSLLEAECTVELDDLPLVTADPVQMRQLFQNLLSNAVTFRSPGEAARISVTATVPPGAQRGVHCSIIVADNGIGFDQQYASLILEPFQRLHGRLEYSGTGIGLAISERIVTRHGGSLSAESTPGCGTTFTIRLPLAHAAMDRHLSTQVT
ncbi:MAG: PAS domain S-box protein [Gemmatimonadaceae bacterium]|nr:PAS domain S-box protein [Gemmatimonadaceae bacterium]